MHVVKEDADLLAISKKLHQQFGHPSSERLKKLIKDAGNSNEELFNMIDMVTNTCDTCKRYKISPPKPAVTFPLATVFNDTLAMDLKVFQNNKVYFFHIIDHATRFSASSVIYSKKAEVIITSFFNIWIAVFGSPKRILSDNGGEFANRQFMDMCDNLGIEFMTTAAEAHWSNGLVEKHNDLLGLAVYKIIEDVGCSVEIALSWAVNAKNSLQNIHGFSSYQLVFGRNPNLPSAMTSNLPALEGVSESKAVADQLNALHTARQEHIKLESAERLRRALRAKTRTHNNIRYVQGDKVYYKEEDQKRWKGSAVVIGQDGSKVLLKIPTGLKSVHTSRVILTSDSEENIEESRDYDDPESNTLAEPPSKPNPDHVLDLNTNRLNSLNSNVDKDVNSDQPIEQSEEHENSHNLETSVIEEGTDNQEMNADNIFNELRSTRDLPKNHQYIDYKLKNSEEWRRCKVLSRGGKSTGDYKYYLNIRNTNDNSEECVDWEKSVSQWKAVEENILMASTNSSEYLPAKLAELEKWKDMGVYDEVDDIGQSYVSVRWVLTEKIKEGTKVMKARLVARGYEDDLGNERTDSPTVNKESLRLAYTIFAGKQWEINSLDIKAAFLQGQPLTREVYLKPPREAKMKGKLWRLRQCVYGLNDASRKFYFKVKEENLKLGCQANRLDTSIFTFHSENTLKGLMMSHVDDFLWAGAQCFQSNVISKIKQIFQVSSENSSLFKYLGIDIQQTSNGIIINQINYAKEIEEIQIDSSRLANPDDSLTEQELKSVRSVIGKLSWLATQTRPDLAYDVCHLSTSVKHGKVGLMNLVNRVVKKAKSEEVCLFYPCMDLDNLKVVCYSDASYGNLRDGGSQMGSYIEITDGNSSCPVDWFSKRIRRAAKSTMAAETIAMVDTFDAAFYLSKLLSQILYNSSKDIPIVAVTDNRSLFESAFTETSITDKRLRIELAIIREYLENKEVSLSWTDSKSQLADCLTKQGCDSRQLLMRISGMTM